ncbi:MAG: DMT family transporter, partial [Microbacteriaceae bacterium]
MLRFLRRRALYFGSLSWQNDRMLPYVLLSIAIVAEVIGTTALKMSDGFTKLWPSVVVVVGYLGSFALLGIALARGLSMSVGYAIWAGVGTALIAVLGIFLFRETIAPWGFVGL